MKPFLFAIITLLCVEISGACQSGGESCVSSSDCCSEECEEGQCSAYRTPVSIGNVERLWNSLFTWEQLKRCGCSRCSRRTRWFAPPPKTQIAFAVAAARPRLQIPEIQVRSSVQNKLWMSYMEMGMGNKILLALHYHRLVLDRQNSDGQGEHAEWNCEAKMGPEIRAMHLWQWLPALRGKWVHGWLLRVDFYQRRTKMKVFNRFLILTLINSPWGNVWVTLMHAYVFSLNQAWPSQ